VLRHGRQLRSTWRWKTSRTAEAYALHGAPAEAVLAAFELSHRIAIAIGQSERAEEATGMSAALERDQPRGRTTPGGEWIGRERSEDRVVKRGPPRSHLHRAAPSFSVPGLLVTAAFTGGVGWGERHAARRRAGGHEAQASERESSDGRRRKVTRERRLRRETTSARVFEFSVSESRSRSNAPLSAGARASQSRASRRNSSKEGSLAR